MVISRHGNTAIGLPFYPQTHGDYRYCFKLRSMTFPTSFLKKRKKNSLKKQNKTKKKKHTHTHKNKNKQKNTVYFGKRAYGMQWF